MNIDIRIAVSFRGHRKRKRLKLLLGEDATGYLVDLWISAALERPDGKLRGLDEVDIALMAGWTEDPGKFVDALLHPQVKFLERDDDGLFSLHDWEEHNEYAASAADRSDKSRLSRMAKTHPDVYMALRRAGVTAVSVDDYRRLTTVERPSNDRKTVDEPTPKDAKPGAQRFVPPSVADVAAYCAERNNGVDPQRFHDFYASKGWMVGKTKMKDWQACVRTWENGEKDRRPTSPHKPSPMRAAIDKMKGDRHVGGGNGQANGDEAGTVELTQDADGRYAR